jgi:hypothetical protein
MVILPFAAAFARSAHCASAGSTHRAPHTQRQREAPTRGQPRGVGARQPHDIPSRTAEPTGRAVEFDTEGQCCRRAGNQMHIIKYIARVPQGTLGLLVETLSAPPEQAAA